MEKRLNNMRKNRDRKCVMLVTMNGDSSTTGFAVRVIMIGKTLADAGFKVTLLRLYPALRAQGSWRNQLDDRIELIELPIPPTARFPLLRKISLIAANLAISFLAKIKCVDFIQAEAHEAGLAVLRRKPSNTIVTVDFHGAAPEESPSYRSRSQPHWLDIAESTCLQSADAALVVSPRMIDHLQAKHPHERLPEFFLVPVNVEESFFEPHNKSSIRAELGFLDNDLVYVYSGGAQSYQCIAEMATLFKLLRVRDGRARLLIISTQKNEFRQIFKNTCPEYLSEIIFISASKAKMPKLLTAGDIGFLLRKPDTLNDVSCPTKFGEYLACGLAVVTTPWAGHAPNIVQKYGVGTIVNFDIESSITLIENLASKLSQELSTHCTRIARDNMHWSSSAENLLKCYAQLENQKKLNAITSNETAL